MTLPHTSSSSRPLRRRLLALVAATVSGLALLAPSIASADSDSTTPVATPAPAVSPASASWSGIVQCPDSASWSAVGSCLDLGALGVQPDSASWSAPTTDDSASWS